MRLVTVVTMLLAWRAFGFCGFFVSTKGAKLTNTTSHVVLMRSGTRTVLSMRNDYAGPVEDFALVVPVPVVLTQSQVKTLPADIFDQLERYSAPRLVAYREEDPCPDPSRHGYGSISLGGRGSPAVRVEGRFEVGEYDVVVLSSADALALEAWLKTNGYRLPDGAGATLNPYVQQGMKFFVARVNVKRVRFENGVARLSPLRFHYDSERFSLPVRLGRLNADGSQELLVHILGRARRYEVANRPNVFLPTNVDLTPAAAPMFEAWQRRLFERVVERHPGAAVTEYAWELGSCDPCSGDEPDLAALLSLGLDVIDGPYVDPDLVVTNVERLAPDTRAVLPRELSDVLGSFRSRFQNTSFVLTRLHLRLDDSTRDDLVFREAPPVSGGREVEPLDGRARPATENTFQGRFAIRSPWTGAAACKRPRWGVWSTGDDEADAGVQVPLDRPMEALVESPLPDLGIKGRKLRPGASFQGKPSE